MKNKIKIQVTAQHIKNGNVCALGSCPIALAVMEQLESPKVSVAFNCRFIKNEGTYAYKLSRAAKRFIMRFDNHKPVKPFSFIMTKGKG